MSLRTVLKVNNLHVYYKYKKSVLNIGVYFLASFIPMAINVAINPLVALNMSPEDYGIVGYYSSFNLLISPLVSFYSIPYYVKRFFEVSDDEREKLRVTLIQSLVVISFGLSIISISGIYIYIHFFNTETTFKFFPYAFLSVFTLPLTALFSYKLVDYKMQKRGGVFFRLSILRSIVIVSFTLLLVVLFKLGALGKLAATFSGMLIIFLGCAYSERRYLKASFDWGILKKMFIFVWPLTLAAMLGFFSNGYDMVYLERLGDTRELGYYVVGLQMAGYIVVFRTAIGNTFQPDIYEAMVKRNWKKAAKFFSLNVVFTSIVVLGFILFAPFVIDILTAGRYVYSARYAKIIAFSQITSSLYYVVTEITIVLGYTKIALVNKIVGSVLCVVMFSVLIAKWGFVGAAWGQVLSFVVFMIVNIIFLFYTIKWENNKKSLIIV